MKDIRRMEEPELIAPRKNFLNQRYEIFQAVYDASVEKGYGFVSCTEVYDKIDECGNFSGGLQIENGELCRLLDDYCNSVRFLGRESELIEIEGKKRFVPLYKLGRILQHDYMQRHIGIFAQELKNLKSSMKNCAGSLN